MTSSPTFKIESFIPDQKDLKAYALAFKESVPNWQNFLGDPIYMTQEKWEEDAEKLIKAISNASPTKCITLLKKYEAIPEKLFRITELSSGASESLPIYTGIRQISLEGQGSILAEAFFGAEFHLLDAAGRLMSIYDYEYPPELGLGQLYLIDCNSQYDSVVKGRRPNSTFVEIVGYAPENISRSFALQSKRGGIYEVVHQLRRSCEQTIIGTGNAITVNNLKYLGKYHLSVESDGNKGGDEGLPGSWVVIYSHSVGLEWKNIRDFTIQYNTFPFLDQRDHWVMQADALSAEDRYRFFAENWQDREFIEKHLEEDPLRFQFMPPEIRGNRAWVKSFCLKEPGNYQFVETSLRNDRELAIELIRSAGDNTRTIYPYLTESLRKDLDILLVMKETGNLFHLPIVTEVGESKFNDIREFVSNNRSRIYEALKLFPNVLHYAPQDVLTVRQLLLHALPHDNKLLAILSVSLRDDPEIIMAAADTKYKNFAALKFASSRLREDTKFVMQMLEKCGDNICFAADWMRSDRKFVLAALQAGATSNIFKYLPDHFCDDEEIMIEFVKKGPFGLDKASERLRLDKAFNLRALNHGVYYHHNIHKSLLNDRDIVLKAMQIHPHEFEHIPEQFKADREIVLTVVSREGGYGSYIKDCPLEMRDDPELIKAAVKDNEWNIKHASPRLLADRYFLAEIIYENPSSFSKIPEDMQRDPGLRELARRRTEELKMSEPSKPENL